MNTTRLPCPSYSLGALSLLLFALGCGATSPPETQSVPASANAEANEQGDDDATDQNAQVEEHTSGNAPTPYTAEAIRESCREGVTYVHEVTEGPNPASLRRMRFGAGTAEQAHVEMVHIDDAGTPQGTARVLEATWEDLRNHAAYPADQTTITETTVQTPAGDFAALYYMVRGQSAMGPSVIHAWFAKDIPGPPVKHIVEVDGRPVSTMLLVKYERPE